MYSDCQWNQQQTTKHLSENLRFSWKVVYFKLNNNKRIIGTQVVQFSPWLIFNF